MNDNITQKEPSLNIKLKQFIEEHYENDFKDTSRTNIFNMVNKYNIDKNIKENYKNIKEYIKYHRIGIPDYIYWKYDKIAVCDFSLDNDDE